MHEDELYDLQSQNTPYSPLDQVINVDTKIINY